jgi:hypothetical protein
LSLITNTKHRTFINEEGYYDEDAMYDTLSEGSEDDGVAVSDEVEADLTSYDDMSDDLLDDLLKGAEHQSDPSSEDKIECREAGFQESLRAPVDDSLTMELNDAERKMLMAVHVRVPSVPNCMDISMVDEAVCDTGLSMLEDEVLESEDMEIKTGMVFDTLEHVKYFLQDYAVRVHRPYHVTHYDKAKRYMILCKSRCGWGVWVRKMSNEKWRIQNVKQPHTCRSLKVKKVHPQNIAHYLGHRIVAVVRADSDTSVSSLIETIRGFTSYRVKYSKAWWAKKHVIQLLWGDWKEAYNQVPRILSAMKHFNPGLRWYPHVGCIVDDVDGIPKATLHRVFWCFP